MVRIKLVLLSSFLFFQGIRGFCVYNKLTDGSSFRIAQNYFNPRIPIGQAFSKHMEKDSIECCPYTNSDCSPTLKNDKRVYFDIQIFFMDESSFSGTVYCRTGGGLTIHGTKEKYYAECLTAEGITEAIPIE
ncbi:hypothetical protein EDC94DRAFT_584126 [Helicostylum pulchrum]|nr:hypothetical protein EDC94DRAFT_584126 [Helicostylum pulchrum]